MGYRSFGYSKKRNAEEVLFMESSEQFVRETQEQQKKQEANKRRQGNGHPEKRLPNKQH